MAPRRLVRRGHCRDDFGAAVVCLMASISEPRADAGQYLLG